MRRHIRGTLSDKPPILLRGCVTETRLPANLSSCTRCSPRIAGVPPAIHTGVATPLEPQHVFDMRLHMCVCVSVCLHAFSSHPNASARPP